MSARSCCASSPPCVMLVLVRCMWLVMQPRQIWCTCSPVYGRTCLTAMPMLHHGTGDTSTGKSWAMRRRLWCRQDVVPLYVAFNALLLLLYLLQIQWMAGIFRCNRQLQLTLTQVHHAAVLVTEMSLHSTPITSATVICR